MIRSLLIITISAMIGWITNYIAIKMLFRPYKEINLFFFKIQGLIPKRRGEIAESLSETIQGELISINDIIKKIENLDLTDEFENIIDKIIETKILKEITNKFPMIAMFLNQSAIDKIKETIKSAILENKEDILKIIFHSLEKNIDFKSIIKEKINAFSLEKLEDITFTLAKKELKHIEIIGAILGGVIGVVQVLISMFI